MSHRLRPFFARALAVLLTATGLAASAQSTPLAYRVKGPQGSATLLGSIHLGKKGFYPLPAALDRAWAGSDTLAVEADASDPAAMAAVAPRMILLPPENLEKALRPEGWKQVQPRLAHPKVKAALQKAGIPEMAVRMFRPWALSMSLALAPAMELGLRPDLGIDHHYLAKAKAEGRPVVQLESLEAQMDLLAGMPEAVQRQGLVEGLDGLITGKATRDFGKLLKAWEKGDERALLQTAKEAATTPETRTFLKKLLDDRNVGMAEGVDQQLKAGKRVFVVVGALHLPGPQGVAALLRKKGYTVTRLK